MIKDNSVGVIKMEVARSTDPNWDFLREVRNLATRNDIVLVSMSAPLVSGKPCGLHMEYEVEPDIAMEKLLETVMQ